MAIAFDARTTSTNTSSFSHTPVGTPKGVLFFYTDTADDTVTAVTYGGVSMTSVIRAAQGTGGASDMTHCWFLGSSIPTGVQTVAYTATGPHSSAFHCCITVTAATDTEVVGSGKVESASTTDPSVTISSLTRSAYTASAMSNGYSVNSTTITAGTGQTMRGNTTLGGNSRYIESGTAQTVSGTTVATAFVNNAAPADTVAMSVVGIQEAEGSLYWIGGSASWNGTASTKWSFLSGGASCGFEPTSSDSVYLDSSSGASTVTVATTTAICKNLTCTGFTGTLAGSTGMDIYGSLIWGSGMTVSNTGTKNFKATSSKTVTSNGKTTTGNVTFNGASGTWTLQDALTLSSTATLTVTQGTFNANNLAVTCGAFASSGSSTRTVTMGTNTWTINGDLNPWNTLTTTNLTLTPSTSTIKLTGTLTTDRLFAGGSKTFGTYWNATSGNFNIIMSGSNTFATLKFDPGRKNQFTAGTTQTFTTLTATGTAGNLITLNSTSDGNLFTLKSATQQNVVCDYLSLKDCNATFI